jgi:hypothetical protein
MQLSSPRQLLASQGWWVARTAPQYTLKVHHAVDSPSWVALRPNGRTLMNYIFVCAGAHSCNAWTLPGFRGWLTTGSKRSVVSDEEFEKFPLRVELPPPQRGRILLRINGNIEIRTLGAA